MPKRVATESFAREWSDATTLVPSTTRLRLLTNMCTECHMTWLDASTVDTAVYTRHDGEAQPYLDGMRSLLYNLQTNPRLRALSGADLAGLSDEDMRQGTVLEEIERGAKQRQAHFEAMLQQRYESLESERPLMRCRRCKKSHLAFEQKQTRGADESMTVFVSCKECGLHWKL